MSGHFSDEVLKTHNLIEVIQYLSPDIGETMLDFMNIYDRHYKNGSSYSFVISSLAHTAKLHLTMSNFSSRTDLTEDFKRDIIGIVVARLYKIGEEWLIKNGHSKPAP